MMENSTIKEKRDSIIAEIKKTEPPNQQLIGLTYAVFEFFTTENEFHKNLEVIKDRLNNPDLKKSLVLDDYRQKLNRTIEQAKNVNWDSISNANDTRDALKSLENILSSKEFEQYYQDMASLTIMYEDVQKISEKNAPPEFRNALITPVQRLPRYPMLLDEITSRKNKLEQVANTYPDVASHSKKIRDFTLELNTKMAVQDQAKLTISQRKNKNKILREFISAISTQSTSGNIQDNIKKYPGEYLKNTLPSMASKIFKKKGHEIQVKPGTDKMMIEIALGLPVNQDLNPAKFDANALGWMETKDNKNPIWAILKATKPIDDKFSAEKKKRALENLADVVQSKKIGREIRKSDLGEQILSEVKSVRSNNANQLEQSTSSDLDTSSESDTNSELESKIEWDKEQTSHADKCIEFKNALHPSQATKPEKTLEETYGKAYQAKSPPRSLREKVGDIKYSLKKRRESGESKEGDEDKDSDTPPHFRK